MKTRPLTLKSRELFTAVITKICRCSSPLYRMVWYLHITYAQPPLPVYFKSDLDYLIQYKCHVKVAGAWHIRVCFLELPGIPCAGPPPQYFWLVVGWTWRRGSSWYWGLTVNEMRNDQEVTVCHIEFWWLSYSKEFCFWRVRELKSNLLLIAMQIFLDKRKYTLLIMLFRVKFAY